MKTRLRYLLFLVLLSVACTPPPAESRTEPGDDVVLRVGTYNIRSALDARGETQLERIAADIREANLDIVALQEVDRGTRRSGDVHQAKVLAELLGMDYAFSVAHPWMDGGTMGNAVLTRLELVSSTSMRLPGSILRIPRVSLETLIRAPSGDEVIFVSAHFSLDDRDRRRAAEWLDDRFQSGEGPVILAADLNEGSDGAVLDALAPAWRLAGGPATYPADSPRRDIDQILVYPKQGVRILEVEVAPQSISDHRMLVAEILIPRP